MVPSKIPDAPSVLLVDDDVVFRVRLGRAFRERGSEVTMAGSVDEALAVARQGSPELAVVDLRMPGRGGLELVRELRALDASTRILVLTGYGSIATAVEAVRLGALNYAPKPADVDDSRPGRAKPRGRRGRTRAFTGPSQVGAHPAGAGRLRR